MPPPWPCETEHTELEAALRELEDLRATLRTRPVIEQAKGILMAQQRVSADTAFDLLRQQSQHANRKLRDLAREIVDGVV